MGRGRVTFLLVIGCLLTLFLTSQSGNDDEDPVDAAPGSTSDLLVDASTTSAVVIESTEAPETSVADTIATSETVEVLPPMTTIPQTTEPTTTETLAPTSDAATTTVVAVTTSVVVPTLPLTTVAPVTTGAPPTTLRTTTTQPRSTTTLPRATTTVATSPAMSPPPTAAVAPPTVATTTTTTVLIATGPPPVPSFVDPTTTASTVAPTTVPPTEAPTTAAATTTTVAPTTSAAPTTTAPVVGSCDAEIKRIAPKDVKNASDGPPSPLEEHVVVTVEMSGSCGALGISYDAANAGVPGGSAQWLLLGGNTTITIAWPEGQGWSDGKHTLLLQNGRGTTPLHSKDLTVK